jgi:hypothetical protein
MPRLLLWPPLLVALGGSLSACGGKMLREEADAGDGGSGGSSNVAGSGSGGKASGGSVSGGASGKTQCDPAVYEDHLNAPSVSVRLVNGTGGPIFLGSQTPGCGLAPLFEVEQSDGRRLTPFGYCETTCQQILSGQISGCPPIPCPISSVIQLEPGEGRVQPWVATYTELVKLPPVCVARVGADECERVQDVKPGAYVFTAQAASGIQCAAPQAPCDLCTRDSNGGCAISNAVLAGPLRQAVTDVVLDGSYGIGAPGNAMTREVVVTFE